MKVPVHELFYFQRPAEEQITIICSGELKGMKVEAKASLVLTPISWEKVALLKANHSAYSISCHECIGAVHLQFYADR